MDLNLGKRRKSRTALKTAALLFYEGQVRQVQVINLSAGGLFALASQVLPVGTRLRLKLELAGCGQEIICQAEVAWVRAAATQVMRRFYPLGMGLRFINLPALPQRTLDQYVSTLRSLGGLDTRIGRELQLRRD